LPPIAPAHRPEYKVFTVPAGDSIEAAFNAVACESFQYAGSVQRYGLTEFISSNGCLSSPSPLRTVVMTCTTAQAHRDHKIRRRGKFLERYGESGSRR
jgi:hypothetical protein